MSTNKINPIFEALSDVDERHVPVNKKKRFPQRLVIAAAAALIIGVVGVIAAMTLGKANVATADIPGIEEVEVKSGKYYLNGDVDSGLWIVVTPETISLKGDDIETSMREAIAEMLEKPQEEINEAAMQDYLAKERLLYCEEKPYLATVCGGSDKYRCLINVDRFNNPVENREDLLNSGAAFRYDDITDTIHLSLFGDFILVE